MDDIIERYKNFLPSVIISVLLGIVGSIIASQIQILVGSKLATAIGIAITLITLLVLFLLYPLIDLQIFKIRRTVHGYYLAVITDSKDFVNDVSMAASTYFMAKQIPKGNVRPLIDIKSASRAQDWIQLAFKTKYRLNMMQQRYEQIHLVGAGRWLWNFALGTLIADRHSFQLYQYHENTFYPIWDGTSLHDNVTNSQFVYKVGDLKRPEHDENRDRAALIVAVGQTHIIEPTREKIANQWSDIPIAVYKIEDKLDFSDKQLWKNAATEIAHSIRDLSQGGSREIYLLGIAPAALGLMAGTAVRQYVRVKLLQYIPAANDFYYQDIANLPFQPD